VRILVHRPDGHQHEAQHRRLTACDAFNAYHVERGTVSGVDVSGLNYVRDVRIPGNVLTPASCKQVVFIDDRAWYAQLQAILDAYDGKLGGPLADLAGLIGETLGVELAAITDEVHDGNAARVAIRRGTAVPTL
jgi:hypothetical protein